MSETPPSDVQRDPQLARIYRAASADAPSAELDAAILAAAHRAVGAKPRSTGHSFIRSWRGALSAAAVIVLSASLVIVMREEAPDVVSPFGMEEQPAPDSKLKYDLASKNVEEASSARRAKKEANTPSGIGLKPSSESPSSGLAMPAPATSSIAGHVAKDAP